MANNNVLFNAAYKGALVGISSRWDANSNSGTVNASPVAASLAFATMVDSKIAENVQGYTADQAEMLAYLCSGLWDDRMPVSDVPSTYEQVADSIVSLFNAALANLLVPSNPVGPLQLTFASATPGVIDPPDSTVESVQANNSLAIICRGFVDLSTIGALSANDGVFNFTIPEIFNNGDKSVVGYGLGTIVLTSGAQEIPLFVSVGVNGLAQTLVDVPGGSGIGTFLLQFVCRRLTFGS